MVRLIAHRGNYKGKNNKNENFPDYITEAINKGYDVECDVRSINDKIFLGHDDLLNSVDLSFFFEHSNKLWIHCKNFEALSFFTKYSNNQLNFFWQEDDLHSLTSKGYIWSHSKCNNFSNNIACLVDESLAHKLYKKNLIFGLCMDNFTFLH